MSFKYGYCQVEQYKQLSVKNGLPSNTIYKAFQDSKGFIWFASDAGVARYDGINFEKFTMDEGLSDNEVLEIKEDSKGRIWFLTFNGQISYMFNEKIYNQENDSIIKNFKQIGFICSMYEDKQHNIWFGRHNKLITKLTPEGQLVNYELALLPMGYHGNQPYFFEQDGLKCMTSDGIFNIDNNGVHLTQVFKTKKIAYFVPYVFNNTKIYYPTINGIYSYSNGQHQYLISDSTLLKFKRISGITLNKNEDLWVTTEIGRTFLYQKTGSKYNFKGSYLEGFQVLYVLTDKEHNTWFCTRSNGVFFKASSGLNVLSKSKEQGLHANEIISMHLDKFNGIWMGYDDGKVQYYKDNKLVTFDCNFFKQTINRILEIKNDSAGNILLASDVGIIFIKREAEKFSTPKFIRLEDNQDGGRPYYAKSINVSSNNRIYFNSAVCRGFLFSNHLGYFAKVDTTNSKRERIFTSYIDKKGNYWISTNKGLIRNDNNIITAYYDKNIWFKQRLVKIAELSDGNLILCTAGSGLALFNKNKILSKITTKDKLGSNTINDIFILNDILYIATNKGVSCFAYKNGKLTFKFNYDSNEGLLSNKVNAIVIKDSLLYAATSEGLSIVKFSNYKFKQPNLITAIKFFKVNGENQLVKEKINIDYKKSHFQVHFKTPVFTHPELLSYQYQLKGKSENWVSTNNDFVEFYGLLPGKYTFKVRAVYNNTVDSSPAEITFTITPPFWQTAWFTSIVILTAIAILYISIRDIAKRKYEKQLILFESERRLTTERTRIADEMHDDVGADLSNLLLKIRMDELKYNNNGIIDLIGLRQATSNIIKKMDEIIWSLNAQKDTLEDLVNFIAKYHHDLINSNNMSGALKLPSYIPNYTIGTELKRDIYLAVKEVLNNALKHAKANELNLSIKFDEVYFEIVIQDNGIGFDKDKKFTGNGLKNIQKRILKNKGHLILRSTAHNGTEINLKFPMG